MSDDDAILARVMRRIMLDAGTGGVATHTFPVDGRTGQFLQTDVWIEVDAEEAAALARLPTSRETA